MRVFSPPDERLCPPPIGRNKQEILIDQPITVLLILETLEANEVLIAGAPSLLAEINDYRL